MASDLDSTNIKANWLTTASKLALVNGKPRLCHLPLDIPSLSARNRQHLFVWIDPHDMPVRSYPLGRSTSQRAGTAANIKHAVSRADSRCIGNAWPPLGEEGRDNSSS